LAIADLDNMDFGNDMLNYTLTVTWYTQLAKVTIPPIGSMLKLTGDVFPVSFVKTNIAMNYCFCLELTSVAVSTSENLMTTLTSQQHGK
jgi:hypothetical protein